VGHVACNERNVRTFVVISEGKRTLSRLRNKWKDSIKVNLKDEVCESLG
jgi:hypothetical protein